MPNKNNNIDPQDYKRDDEDSNITSPRVVPNMTDEAFTINGITLGETTVEYNESKLPGIGNLTSKNQYKILLGVSIVSILGLATGTYINQQVKSEKTIAQNLASQIQSELKVFEGTFKDVVLGKSGAFPIMLDQRDKVNSIRKDLENMNEKIGSDETIELNSKLTSLLDKLKTNIAVVEKEKNTVVNLENRISTLDEQILTMQNSIDNIQIGYVKTGMTEKELDNFLTIKKALTVIDNGMANMLLKEKFSKDLPEKLTEARKSVAKAIEDVYYGSNKGIRPLDIDKFNSDYQNIAGNFVRVANEVDTYVSYAGTLTKIKGMVEDNDKTYSELYSSLQKISKNIGVHSKESSANLLFVLFAILLLLSLLSIFYVYVYDKENKTYEEKKQNAKLQNAIYLLVKEIIPLQDGDLRQKATVSDEFIGSIADSINITVASLSSLVKKIQETSITMREKTNDVSIVALQMLNVSELQSSSIETTGTDVLKINNAITEISERTAITSKQAINSVDIAEAGASQVHSAIESMQSISSNMTETGVLMRKVSDSSKQITEILILLSDITEQTNILALNATIQAAKAGDSGSGFKIVADSIQTLADKASEATRKVGALIGTVQTDIQSVGLAIAKTTVEVKNGVDLSEQAGASLKEMIKQSQALAVIVEGVSSDSKLYADQARKISANMQKILESTRGNRDATKRTVDSINEIAGISHSLRESVRTFKIE